MSGKSFSSYIVELLIIESKCINSLSIPWFVSNRQDILLSINPFHSTLCISENVEIRPLLFTINSIPWQTICSQLYSIQAGPLVLIEMLKTSTLSSFSA